MSEENTSGNFIYINGQKVYDEDHMEPLIPPMPKSPIDFSIEQSGFLTKELADAKSSDKDLREQNAFIIKELATTLSKDRLLAEQQASILLLLAKQICPPHEEDNSGETPTETPIEEDKDIPEETPVEVPNEEDVPKDGDE